MNLDLINNLNSCRPSLRPSISSTTTACQEMSSLAKNYGTILPPTSSSLFSNSSNNLGLQSAPFSNMPKYFPNQNQSRFDHRTQPQPLSTNFPMQMGDSRWSSSCIHPNQGGGYQPPQQPLPPSSSTSCSHPWSTMGNLPQASQSVLQPLNHHVTPQYQQHHPPGPLPMVNTNVNWPMHYNLNNNGMPGFHGNCPTRHNRSVLPSPMPACMMQTGMSSDSQTSCGGSQYQCRPIIRGMGSQMTNYQQQQQQQQKRIHSTGQLQMTQAGSQMRNFQNNSQMTSMSSGQPLTSTQMQAAQMAGEFMSSNPGQVRQMGQQHQRQQSQSQQQHQQNFPVPQTIRVGVLPPGSVLEPQTIRVTAPTPQPIHQELPTPFGFGQNYNNYNHSKFSWGELLVGEKSNNGLDSLKVVMAAPLRAADTANQNRQLRVPIGNQFVEGRRLGPIARPSQQSVSKGKGLFSGNSLHDGEDYDADESDDFDIEDLIGGMDSEDEQNNCRAYYDIINGFQSAGSGSESKLIHVGASPANYFANTWQNN